MRKNIIWPKIHSLLFPLFIRAQKHFRRQKKGNVFVVSSTTDKKGPEPPPMATFTKWRTHYHMVL